MHRDTVVGLVGAAVLVAALVGIFWYEGSRAVPTGSLTWDVAWSTEAVNGPQRSGDVAEGGAATATADVLDTGLAILEFALVWRDDVGTADRFRLTVAGPGGLTGTAEGANAEGAEGEVRVPFPGLNPAPTAERVVATDEEDARRKLTSHLTAGAGTWTATVELLEAGDQSAPVPGLPPVTEDDGQAWTLKTVVTRHAPSLSRS